MAIILKIPICIISITLLLSFHNVSFADSSRECIRKLKIGVSLPLTAAAISSGEAVKNSIILADEKYDTRQCVEFLFEDDQLLAKNTLSIVNRFVDIEHVDGLIIYGTPTSIAVGNFVEKNRLPMIALSILGKVVQDKKFIVKHWCTAERLNEAVNNEVRRRGYKRVAIVTTQNDAMLGLRDLYVNNKTTQVVLDEEHVRDSSDFRSSILKIISKNADAVYLLLFPPQTGIFAKQLRAHGFNGEVFGVHNMEDPGEVETSAGAMIGMWLANGDETAGENYRSEYLKRFGTETSLGGASGFDSAKMFIEASQQHGDTNDYLHHLTNFNGAFGTYSSTENNDFNIGAVIKVIEKDGFKKLLIKNN